MIRDQSNGYAIGALPTVDNVWAYWRAHLAQKGMEPHRVEKQVVAYVNDSRWIADCKCNGGMICWVENPETCCLDCGAVYSVKFPPGAAKALELLNDRPEHARNWNAHKGESVANLALENAKMLGPKFGELGGSLGEEPPFFGV